MSANGFDRAQAIFDNAEDPREDAPEYECHLCGGDVSEGRYGGPEHTCDVCSDDDHEVPMCRECFTTTTCGTSEKPKQERSS